MNWEEKAKEVVNKINKFMADDDGWKLAKKTVRKILHFKFFTLFTDLSINQSINQSIFICKQLCKHTIINILHKDNTLIIFLCHMHDASHISSPITYFQSHNTSSRISHTSSLITCILLILSLIFNRITHFQSYHILPIESRTSTLPII